MSEYLVTIGLETHVQLKTKSKMFCGCPRLAGEDPNLNVCPVCLGYPGTLPVMNEQAVLLTVKTGLMIGSEISRFSKFDRKNYFYPDMPKNYQISQFDKPLCIGGQVEIEVDGEQKAVCVTRIHLEEDVAKNTHVEGASLIDFNRAGTPLMEIVTDPVIESADEAFAYLQALKQILQYGQISDCNLEEGNIRCDVNCSVRPVGQEKLGVKTEIKNMNTFKGVHRALTYEIQRQIRELKAGNAIVQETRRWDDAAGATYSMRSKEYAHDYRYFPEPDLMPVVLESETIQALADSLPELPAHRRARLVEEYGIPDYDAGVLVADKEVADFYEAAAKASGLPKAVSNWMMTEMLRVLSEKEITIKDIPVSAAQLASLVKLVDGNVVNSRGAKEVFAELVEKGGDPKQIIEARGLAQESDTSAIDQYADQAISEHPESVADYQSGKKAALQFLVGQVMRLSKGKANPQMAAETLKNKLSS